MSKKKTLYIHGVATGVMSAMFGCALFILLEHTKRILQFGSLDFNKYRLEIVVFMFIVGTLVVLFPTIISSVVLAELLYRDHFKNKLTLIRALGYGVLVGGLNGILASVLGIILVRGRVDFRLYLTYSFEICTIASICGALTSGKIRKYISSNNDFLA